jgi:hypothetical protein
VTFAVKTPSGGEHLYFDADKVYANSVKALGEGLDVRSGNGFVVGPGSVLHVPEEFEPDSFVPVSYEVVHDGPFSPLPGSIKGRLREAMQRSADAHTSLNPDTIDSDENIALAREYLKNREPAIQGRGGDEHTKTTSEGVRDFNISEDLCYDLMLELFNDRCDPPWEPEELRVKVHNGYKYAKRPMGTRGVMSGSVLNEIAGETTIDDMPAGFYDTPEQVVAAETKAETKKKYVFYDGSAVLSVDRHYDFIISDWLPSKNYTIVLGSRGSGKTTVIIDAVCHVVSDAGWHNTEVDTGWYFIYIAGEDFEGVKDRYEAWCCEHQSLCNFNEETEQWELKDPGRLQFIPLAVDLMVEEEVVNFANAVADLVRTMRVRMGDRVKIGFVIDTWQRMTSGAVGGQSSDESMQKALNHVEWLADQFHGPCIIAAHPPKANQNTMAGSGIIENRSDAVWTISHIGAGIRNAEVTRVKGAQEGNYKNLAFHSVNIKGFDRFGRQRRSVAVSFSSGSVASDRTKIVSTADEWQRAQDMLELMRDMISRRQAYCPNLSGSITQVKLTEMVMDLYETEEELRKKGRYGDPAIRDYWLEKIRELGFSDSDMRRTRDKRVVSKHHFYIAMERLYNMFKGQGEIGKTGMGIVWTKQNRSHTLSYGKITRITGIDKVEALAANEKVDPDTGEITEGDEDFGDGNI